MEALTRKVAIFGVVVGHEDQIVVCQNKNGAGNSLRRHILIKHEGGYDLCGSHTFQMSRMENGWHTHILPP